MRRGGEREGEGRREREREKERGIWEGGGGGYSGGGGKVGLNEGRRNAMGICLRALIIRL